jgi:hypothetical protein
LCVGDADSNWGVAMNEVSVLKRKEARTMASDRTSRRQGEAQSCELISLRSFLEAENKRLQQAALGLSCETAALRQLLEGLKSRTPTAQATPKARRLPRPRVAASAPVLTAEPERRDLPFSY